MDAESPNIPDGRKEDTDKIVRACAEACGVDQSLVEKIGSASDEQERRMDHHIDSGLSYMMQMVLHCEGVLNQDFLLRALSAMRFKNHVLRTRLVRHEDQVYQVVLRDSIMYQHAAVGLHQFLGHNSRMRMDYGTPLFRYAFIREPHGETFFIWTVHCSAVDARTLRFIFDDLQLACSDLSAYSKMLPRPPYGRYARWANACDYEAGLTFWLTRHTIFDNLVHRFPVFGPGVTPSLSTKIAKKLLHLPRMERTKSTLLLMGHAAWALAITNVRTQEHAPLVSDDISFITVSSARESKGPGITHAMGPISARVPLRIRLFPGLSIESLMHDIETQLSSMIGYEHCAMKVLSKENGLRCMPKQAVFSWNPPGVDSSSERIVCHDKEAAPAVLDYSADLSWTFAHDYGLLFEVYEHGEHITIRASWDPNLVSADLINRLYDKFRSFLLLIIRMRGVTVSELLFENRVDQYMANCESQRAGVLPDPALAFRERAIDGP